MTNDINFANIFLKRSIVLIFVNDQSISTFSYNFPGSIQMPNISHVAKQAGVSVGTVSRVINDAKNVTPEIRARVEKVISDLGYIPNVFARSLRSRKASSISVIVPAITNGHWRDLVRGAEDTAHSRGYVVLLCNTYDNPIKQRRHLEIAASQNVAGVVIAPYDSVLEDLSPLLERNVATV
ncbi:MAG: LacI family DNA-binding transcriptional regulator, partial [Saprospiraceae bacterium]|nr:LacI family DNA-binding transcriptional regulator [Saprospiraceae bacterium]